VKRFKDWLPHFTGEPLLLKGYLKSLPGHIISMGTLMLDSILPTQLYDVTLNLKERVGNLGGRLSSGVKTYQERYGKMPYYSRIAGLYGGSLFVYNGIKHSSWPVANPIEFGVKLVTLAVCAYMGPEFLASGLTGVSFPIEKYLNERWKRRSKV